jgi:hypothetical protein
MSFIKKSAADGGRDGVMFERKSATEMCRTKHALDGARR